MKILFIVICIILVSGCKKNEYKSCEYYSDDNQLKAAVLSLHDGAEYEPDDVVEISWNFDGSDNPLFSYINIGNCLSKSHSGSYSMKYKGAGNSSVITQIQKGQRIFIKGWIYNATCNDCDTAEGLIKLRINGEHVVTLNDSYPWNDNEWFRDYWTGMATTSGDLSLSILEDGGTQYAYIDDITLIIQN